MTEEQVRKFYKNIVMKLCPYIPEKDKEIVYKTVADRHLSGVDKIYNEELLKLKKSAIAELITLNYGMNTIGISVVENSKKEHEDKE